MTARWTDAPAEVAELRAENERLRRRVDEDDAGLKRWCNYQDRLFAVMTSDEIRAFEKRLDEGGWVNEPLCAHVDSRERAIRWAVTLEGQNAEAAKVLNEFVNVRGDFYEPRPLAAMIERLAAALDVELRYDWRNFVAALTGSTE